MEQFRNADANQDGKLSLEELKEYASSFFFLYLEIFYFIVFTYMDNIKKK